MNCAVGCLIFITADLLHLWHLKDNRRRDTVDAKLQLAVDPKQQLAGLTGKEISDLDRKPAGFRWRP